MDIRFLATKASSLTKRDGRRMTEDRCNGQ